MTRDVPKFVVKRLQESAGAETHPDADLLTAFVEKSLLESERNRVIEHLARCNACRETVALALPASEDAAAITSVKPARTNWFTWPALAWVAATAAIVAVTFIGVRHHRLRSNDASNQVLVSRNLSRNEMAPAPDLAISPPKASSQQPQVLPRVKNGEPAGSPRKMQSNRPAPFSSGALDSLSKNGLSKPQRQSPPAGLAHAAMGRARGVASGSAKAPTLTTPAPAASSNRNSNAGSNAGSNASSDVAQEATVPPSSQTVTVEVESAVTSAPAKSGEKVSSKKVAGSAAPPQWSISSEGALQRSLDAGQTWVDVNPAQALAQSTAKASNEIAREFNKSAAKKIDAPSNPVFRAVAAFGNEVWAGGSAAMLYHSSDSGVHWTRIFPSARGAMLTGDIASIDFSDPQNGVITTSTGEVWITADGGRSWRR